LTIRRRAAGAGKVRAAKPRPRKTRTVRRASSGNAKRAGGITGLIRRLNLSHFGVSELLTALGLAGSVLAFAMGYGKVVAQQELMLKEQDRQGRLIDAIYQRQLWSERGTSGPLLPLGANQ
jgi:hypothetical protein